MPIEIRKIKKATVVEETILSESTDLEVSSKKKNEKKKVNSQTKEKQAVEKNPIAEIKEPVIQEFIESPVELPEIVPILESNPVKAQKKKTKKAKISPETPVSENQSENSNKTKPEEKAPIFQAFGLVKGKILEQGSFYVLQMGEQTYSLFGPRSRVKSFVGNEEEVYLRVYPSWKFNIQNEEVLWNIGFTVVAVLTQCPKNSQVNHFKVRGIWQKLSFLAEPVLIVYRNQSRGNYDHCKPLHLPLQWQDAPVKAFQYDPDLKEKKDYPKRYFCQLSVRGNIFP